MEKSKLIFLKYIIVGFKTLFFSKKLVHNHHLRCRTRLLTQFQRHSSFGESQSASKKMTSRTNMTFRLGKLQQGVFEHDSNMMITLGTSAEDAKTRIKSRIMEDEYMEPLGRFYKNSTSYSGLIENIMFTHARNAYDCSIQKGS